MADLVFIVSRTELKWYAYLSHVYANESRSVILDRRVGERRGIQQWRLEERHHSERRHRNVAPELESTGWALVPHG